jgi:hypothetical protein
MTDQHFTVRAVDNITRAVIVKCSVNDFDAAFDWVEARAEIWAERTGREADIETSVHDANGRIIRWERAGIRVHA